MVHTVIKRNLLKNSIVISIIILNSIIIYSSMNGNASTQAIIVEIELNSQEYNKIYNATHYYSNFSFSLKSLKHYIFIASVDGNLTLKNIMNKNISLISINHPSAIGLQPLEKFFIKFSSEYNLETLERENILINLYVNFQLLVTNEENLRKIVTKTVIFNETAKKMEVEVPSGSVYFSTNYSFESESSSLSYRYDYFFMIIGILLIVLRIKKTKFIE
ncbi:MAG: hypothetical protein HeimC3_40410 [Candidatus Heimdallarchaeota archaeon LC_3]|nr:MAG: hypothetical protein HeimC3_40410 [Candidatus Heimdallarchaeota archaeon LC_3]